MSGGATIIDGWARCSKCAALLELGCDRDKIIALNEGGAIP